MAKIIQLKPKDKIEIVRPIEFDTDFEFGDKILLGGGDAIVENDMVDRVYFRWVSNGEISWVYRKNIKGIYKTVTLLNVE